MDNQADLDLDNLGDHKQFFLCTAEHYSIINPVLLHKFKGYNKENGKPDESLGRKATGPLKWQPVA